MSDIVQSTVKNYYYKSFIIVKTIELINLEDRGDSSKKPKQKFNFRLGPVSYTHLDVYKRQGYNRGSLFEGPW